MDEGVGALIIVGLAVAAVAAVIYAIGALFTGLSELLGHPIVVILFMTAAGMGVALFRHARKHPSAVVSDDDYALIGGLKLPPPRWAATVLAGFMLIIACYGIVVI